VTLIEVYTGAAVKPDDPVSRGAEAAIAHLNADHADALLEAS